VKEPSVVNGQRHGLGLRSSVFGRGDGRLHWLKMLGVLKQAYAGLTDYGQLTTDIDVWQQKLELSSKAGAYYLASGSLLSRINGDCACPWP